MHVAISHLKSKNMVPYPGHETSNVTLGTLVWAILGVHIQTNYNNIVASQTAKLRHVMVNM
jgi:hypothetical protein